MISLSWLVTPQCTGVLDAGPDIDAVPLAVAEPWTLEKWVLYGKRSRWGK